jgi:hypothetical protein
VKITVDALARHRVEPLQRGLEARQEAGRQPQSTGDVRVPGQALVDAPGQILDGLPPDHVGVVGPGRHDQPAVLGACRVVLLVAVKRVKHPGRVTA